MDLSFSDVRAKIDFLQPSDRQNFANALGQKCIHDLRLRHIVIVPIFQVTNIDLSLKRDFKPVSQKIRLILNTGLDF